MTVHAPSARGWTAIDAAVAVEGDRRINLRRGEKPDPNIAGPFLRTVHAAEADMLPDQPSDQFAASQAGVRDLPVCAGPPAAASASTIGMVFAIGFTESSSALPRLLDDKNFALFEHGGKPLFRRTCPQRLHDLANDARRSAARDPSHRQ